AGPAGGTRGRAVARPVGDPRGGTGWSAHRTRPIVGPAAGAPATGPTLDRRGAIWRAREGGPGRGALVGARPVPPRAGPAHDAVGHPGPRRGARTRGIAANVDESRGGAVHPSGAGPVVAHC